MKRSIFAALAFASLCAPALAGNFAFAVSAGPGLNLTITGYSGDGTKLFSDSSSRVEIHDGRPHYIIRVDEAVIRGNRLARWCVDDSSGNWDQLPADGSSKVLCDDWPRESRGTYVFAGNKQASETTTAATPEPARLAPPASEHVIEAVQRTLKEFGYAPGPADGVMGARTRSALRQFSKDTAGPGSAEIDVHSLKAMGLLPYSAPDDSDLTIQANPSGVILVIDERADVLTSRLAKMSQAEILDYLPKLHAASKSKIDLVFERAKSIVFIVYTPLELGDVVKTFHAHILKGELHPWRQLYDYTVADDTPTQPMIIINEFETSNPMFILNGLFLNGEVIASKHTRADK